MWLLNRPGTYSIEKARTMLDYQPLVSIEEGMARVAEWARAEGLIDWPGWVEAGADSAERLKSSQLN